MEQIEMGRRTGRVYLLERPYAGRILPSYYYGVGDEYGYFFHSFYHAKITLPYAEVVVSQAKKVISGMRHDIAAKLMSEKLHYDVKTSTRKLELISGDEALLLHIPPSNLTKKRLRNIDYKLSYLRIISGIMFRLWKET